MSNVTDTIAPALTGQNVLEQRAIDRALIKPDGTVDRSALGGNTLTGVSLAVLNAAADSIDLPLYRYIGGADAVVIPIPFFDMIEGGELASTGLPFRNINLCRWGLTPSPKPYA